MNLRRGDERRSGKSRAISIETHWDKGPRALAWDNLWTLHNAVADYGPGEIRHMRRCQVMADRVFAGDWD